MIYCFESWCSIMEKKKKECFQLLPSVKATICLFILLNLQVAKGDDPCHSYQQIPDFYKRLPKYTATNDLDDHHLLSKWYGLEGFDIPNKVVQAYHCGTRSTIYLNESLPKATMFHRKFKVCVAESYHTCASSFEIEIKGCTSKLRVYHLITSPHLSSGYCFENPDIKALDLPPKIDPNMTVKVEHELRWTEKILLNRAVHIPGVVFRCKFQKAPGHLFYTIRWIIDDNTVIKKHPTQDPDDGRSDLIESDLGDMKYGINIKCNVVAHQSALGLPTTPVESASFFAGIKPKTNKVSVERGKSTSFDLEFTIPFGCIHDPSNHAVDDCVLTVEMDYEPRYRGSGCKAAVGIIQSKTSNHPNFCSTEVKGIAKNGKNWVQTISWNISNSDAAQTGIIYEQTIAHGYKLRLKTNTPETEYFKLWSGYKIGEIEVKITDSTTAWQNARCYAHCDPHMKTFDGTTHELEKAGVFTLYRHRTLPIEVQIQTKPCTGAYVKNVHCVCGTYIRAGGDLFALSSCNGEMHYDYVQCKDNSLTVYYDETKKYVIYLPTGTKVTVTIVSDWMCDVDINPATHDVTNVDGLCGTLDGNKWNDFLVDGKNLSKITRCGENHFECRNDFIDRYKVPDNMVLFPSSDKNKHYLKNLPPFNTDADWYCVCEFDDGREHIGQAARSVCSYKKHEVCNHKVPPMECKDLLIKKQFRRKRDTFGHLDRLEKHLLLSRRIFKKSAEKNKKFKRNVITEQDARRHCESVMHNSKAIQLCNQSIPTVTTDTDMNNCIYDVIVTGDKKWSDSAMNSVKHVCLHQAQYNGTLKSLKHSNMSTGMNITSSGGLDLDLASIIESVVCSNDCSGNGDCVNGTCVCYKNYGASDCSFDLTKPPIIHDSLIDDYCDAAEEHCKEISMRGENFIMSPNLTCKVAVKEIDIHGKISKIRYPLYLQGDGFSPFQVYCPLHGKRHKRSTQTDSSKHFLTSYEISIANDGTLFGRTKQILRFDSTCQTKTSSPNVFNLKSKYCFINGECIQHGQHNKLNKNEKCDVYNKKFFWTDLTKPSSGLGRDAIIGIAVGSAVALAVIVVLIIALILIKKQNAKRLSTPVQKFSAVTKADKLEKYGRRMSPE